MVSGSGVRAAVEGVEVLYYLVHSLSRSDFQDADRLAAELVAQIAADAGVARIVYLGGLRPVEEETPSGHLASRAEVGDIFLRSAVPTVALQAGMITGAGSTSFEMLRHLTDRLPAMIIPRSVGNRTQPIAIADVLRYLLACATLPPEVNRSFDIGGPDVLTYLDVMQRYARIAGLPRPPSTNHAGRDPEVPHSTDALGADGPVYTQHREVPTGATAAQLWQVIEGIGGARGWHTLPLIFELRGWIDQLLGGVGAHRGRRDPQYLRVGEVLDWWRVEDIDPGRRLLLRAEMRMPGTAWLELSVQPRPDGAVACHQDVTFAPTGLAGHLYWWTQRPAHDAVFHAMAHGIAHAAERAPHLARLSGRTRPAGRS
ncbi:MAG: SDR family oxidoreductase [Actinomycetes bacterium]